jgi:hypothetical protein
VERAAVTDALARVLADRPAAAGNVSQLRPMLEDQLQGQARGCRAELSQVLAVAEEGFVVDSPDAADRTARQLAAARGFTDEVATWACYAWLGPAAVPAPAESTNVPAGYNNHEPAAETEERSFPGQMPVADRTRPRASKTQVVLAIVGGLLFAVSTLLPVSKTTQVLPDNPGVTLANGAPLPACAPSWPDTSFAPGPTGFLCSHAVGDQRNDNGFVTVSVYSVQGTVWVGFIASIAIAVAALVLRKHRRWLTVTTAVLSAAVGAAAFYILDNSKFEEATKVTTRSREALPGRYLAVVAVVLIVASIVTGIVAAIRERRSY